MTSYYNIHVFNSFSGEFLQKLRGPTSQVVQLVWDSKDEFVASCSIDGQVNQWLVHKEWKKLEKNTERTHVKVSTLIYNEPTSVLMFAGGVESKGFIWQIGESSALDSEYYRSQ